MSAYAMPGAVFPPMSGFTFMSMSEDSKTQNEINKSKKPLEEDISKISSPTLKFEPVSFSSIMLGSLSSGPPLIFPSTESVSDKGKNNDNKLTGFQNEVGISVKEAKIDHVRLIQSLTTSPKESRKRNTPNSKRMRDLNNNDNDVNDDDPHKEAIEFELSISFNGRTYTAKRTLPSIIQLRNDLIMEMENRSKKMHVRQMRWPERKKYRRRESPVVNDVDVDTIELSQEEDDDDNKGDEFDVTIPEVPKYYPEEKNSGGRLVACGFTMLQALLHQYCPVMEGWLRKVTHLIPPIDSPSLSNFLWEPLFNESVPSSSLGTEMKRRSSLQSIREDESEDGEL